MSLYPSHIPQSGGSPQRNRTWLRWLIISVAIVLLLIALFWPFLQPSPEPVAEQHATPIPTTATPGPSSGEAPTPTIITLEPSSASPTPTIIRVLPTSTPAFSDAFFDSQRLSYEPDFYVPEIQVFLGSQPGPLKDTRFQIGGYGHSFAETLVSMTTLYSINPKVVLALFETQSRLLSTAEPAPDQLTWAMGYHGGAGGRAGLYSQFYWAVMELRYAIRDYVLGFEAGVLPDIVFADASRQPVGLDMTLAHYALARVLAQTTTPDQLTNRLDAFQATYTELFEDPRLPPDDWPEPAEPFLHMPMEEPFRITSVFDHHTPLLHKNGSTQSFWGQESPYISYDGHTGWDYAMRPPDIVLAAAGGTVVFAGFSDDGCVTPAGAVIIDHGNGYRSLYWHLSSITIELGATVASGDPIGVAGETGCAIGPHLHLQVQYLGRDTDPYGWCAAGNGPWGESPGGQQSTWLWADWPDPCGAVPDNTIVIDNQSDGFASYGSWQQSEMGYADGTLFQETIPFRYERQPWELRPFVETPAVATWQPTRLQAGTYRVLAYLPYVLNGLDDSQEIRYRVHYAGGDALVTINGETWANGWADLGTYPFAPDAPAFVSVSSLAGDAGRGIWADAVAWQLQETQVSETSGP
ncbi:MAG: peptidoglycan DD-metalloendopeptidase family protein [Chloroflexaceae bacterium]|nr:peptidoglycan DD-metalloendopeptidase family protein [Chloroflexaceae bacterium]